MLTPVTEYVAAGIGTGVTLALLIAAFCDLASRRIPNAFPATIASLSVLGGAMGGRIIPGLETGLTILVLAAFCWRRGWMGGGDVKLLAAVALGMTPGLIPQFVSAVALAGGALSLLYVAAKYFVPKPHPRNPPAGLVSRILRIEQWRIHRGCPLPYACAIAAGTFYVQL